MRHSLDIPDCLLSLVIIGSRLFKALVDVAGNLVYLQILLFVIVLANRTLKLPVFIRVLALVQAFGKEELDGLAAVHKDPDQSLNYDRN